MESSTKILRRLLDERGVEWEGGKRSLRWRDRYGVMMQAFPLANGELGMGVWSCTPEQAIAATLGPKVTGNTSDGYHTFNELYHHRAVLFSVIVRDHRELAWKSMRHHDGTMYDGMFIVGIETPEGQATYHYDIDPYWDMFNCKELDQAPEWDGHTPSEAIERIATLGSCNCSDNCTNGERTETCHDKGTFKSWGFFTCSNCSVVFPLDAIREAPSVGKVLPPRYCPNCRRRIVEPTTNDVDVEVEQ